MSNFINEQFLSLASGTVQNAGSLFTQAILSKDDLATLMNQLETGVNANTLPLSISGEASGGVIRASHVLQNLTEAQLRLDQLFRTANNISILLASGAVLLGSEIRALEQALTEMEALAMNYGFLLSDSSSYNWAFLERFRDLNGQEIDFDFGIPDRTGQAFDNEWAVDRIDEGALVLSDIIFSYPITAQVIASNGVAYQSSDTGVANIAVPNNTSGWRATFQTPIPTTSSLVGFTSGSGIQAIVECLLSQPSPCSEIAIAPLADNQTVLDQVFTYNSPDDSTGTPLLLNPVILKQSYTLYFPMASISRVKLFISQPVYERKFQDPVNGESVHQQIRDHIKGTQDPSLQIKNTVGVTNQVEDLLQRDVRVLNSELPQYGLPYTSFNEWSGPMNLATTIREINLDIENFRWIDNQEDPLSSTASQIIADQFPPVQTALQGLVDLYQNLNPATDSSYQPQPAEVPPVNAGLAITHNPNLVYEYTLGLLSVRIGVSESNARGVYVSQVLNSPGDVGVAKISVTEEQYTMPKTDRDLPVLTSTEYSVTKASSPQSERDWMPILPANTSTVTGERLFPDSSGKCLFRFPADSNKSINLYVNGYLYSLTQGTFIRTISGAVNGLILPYSNFSPADIFTVSYTVLGDKTVINFANFDIDIPLLSAYDASGVGESFGPLNGQTIVPLRNTPYIDLEKVSQSSYTSTNGTFPYQPISVVLSDGTSPINLTNYVSPAATVTLPLPVPGLYYCLQSKDELIFNQPIEQSFKVYYQYLYNSLRYRIVLRSNVDNGVSPKVTAFQLKGKLRTPNPQGSF